MSTSNVIEHKLWGEFTDEQLKPKYDYSSVIMHAKNPNCLNEYLCTVPNLNSSTKNKKQLILLPAMETRICHTISLHQYAREMSDLIKRKGRHELFVPRLPSFPNIPRKCKEEPNQFGYLHKSSSEFTLGRSLDTPILSSPIVFHILRQCVATLFAHVGFETTNVSILQVLCDVLDEFLKKMCTNLRIAEDNSKLGLTSGFPDSIERVFVEMGLGGIHCLHKYYSNRIINYQQKIYDQCQTLQKEYEELEKEDVPEFHLSGGEDDNNDFLQPELQMLDLLERNDEFSLPDAFSNPATLLDLEQNFNSL